jgi:hypothetical protein
VKSRHKPELSKRNRDSLTVQRPEHSGGHIAWQAVLPTRRAYVEPPSRGSLSACLFILLTSVSLATGQPPLDRNAVVRRPQPFDAKGHVYSVTSGLIRMLTDTQQPWFVRLDRRTQIQVHGEGGAELIAPGVFIRFEAPLIGRRIAAGEIAKLSLFNPDEGFRAGVTADPGPSDDQSIDLAGGPQGEADRTAESGPRRTPSHTRKRPQKSPQGHYLIAGQVRSFRKGNLVVLAGKGGTIKARVAPQAKVTVDTTTYSMVRSGDTIHVTGSYTQPGQVLASKIEIELAPRGLPTDRNARRRARPGRLPADAAEGPLRNGPEPGQDRNRPPRQPDRNGPATGRAGTPG